MKDKIEGVYILFCRFNAKSNGFVKETRGRLKLNWAIAEAANAHLHVLFCRCALRAITFGRKVKKVVENNNVFSWCC